MKKEDAVEILEEVKALDDSMYQYNPAYLEALNMAIESLRADTTMEGEMNEMVEIKRCPFCGANPRTDVRVTQMGGDTDNIDFSVVCGECGTSKTYRLKIAKEANFLDVDIAIEKVLNAWNQRAKREE